MLGRPLMLMLLLLLVVVVRLSQRGSTRARAPGSKNQKRGDGSMDLIRRGCKQEGARNSARVVCL